MNIQRTQKHAKLLQYATRIWHITEGDDETKIDLAIQKTREFFERMGIQTHLADYGLGQSDIEIIINQLEAHGMTQLGEQRDITLDVSRKILQGAW